MLTCEEFASLLTVSTCTVFEPPVVIPTKHSDRLIALGYIADIAGKLRMTTPGRRRIDAGFEKQATAKIKLGHGPWKQAITHHSTGMDWES
jgi:hypothetical protein